MARRSATKARTQAANQIHSLVVTAPEQVKHQLAVLKLKARVESVPAGVPAKHRPRSLTRRRRCGTWPADTKRSTRRSPNSMSRSVVSGPGEPGTVGRHRCGPSQPPLCGPAGDNPGRMGAVLRGAVRRQPRTASSGQTIRHRLNRGGNRQANQALWRIATTRIRHDAATQQYVAKREAEGKNRKEIIRCLKRHIAREIYRLITNPPPTPNCARLRSRRLQAGITITQAAQALRTHPSRISALELGRDHNHQRATRYQDWLRTHEAAPPPI